MLKKLICAVVMPLLLFSSCSKRAESNVSANSETQQSVYTEKAEKVTKTETVYVNLDSSGKLKKVTVTDWIHSDKASVYVDDVSILNDIKNVRGTFMPQKSGEKLRWHMSEENLYYTGTTDKSPPVMFDVEYFLNGNRISADEIAGKSGEVTITIKIRNNLLKEVFINGERFTVALPVAAVGGMILPGNIFRNVTVKNAQKFNDGSKELVAFATVPGFSESFGLLSDSLNGLFSDEIVINATATNFSLDNMYFAVVPFATLNYDMLMPESLGEASNAIASVKAFRDALSMLDPDRIIYSLISDEAKMNSLLGAVNDASLLYDNNKNLIELAAKYSTPENIAAIEKLIGILNTPEVKAVLEFVSDPAVVEFISGLPVIMENLGEVEPLITELQKDLSRPEVQKELSDLPRTLETLSSITEVFSQNKKELDAVYNALESGGGESLGSVLESLDGDGTEMLEGDVIDNSDLLVALAEEWLEFATEYGLFSGKEDDMNYSLMFIYKTERIVPHVS